jgi:hypothetical protein
MSADNGTYILVTKGPEYRVANLQAIENMYDSTNPSLPNKEFISLGFGGLEPINTVEDALMRALAIEEEQMVSEYGIRLGLELDGFTLIYAHAPLGERTVKIDVGKDDNLQLVLLLRHPFRHLS